MDPSRANNIHTWSGIAARQSLVRHKLSYSQSKTLILLAVPVSQVSSVQIHLSLHVLPHRYLCAATLVQVHVHVHVKVMHVWVYSTYLPKSESVLLRVSLWSLRLFLSPYCQALLSCCLHGFLTVWGAMYPPVPSQPTNTPRWPQPELKVSTEPTASSGEVTLEKFLCLLYLTEKQVSPQSCE